MARKKRKRIASRGSVNTTILKTLINGDKYGYEIIKEVEEYSEGKIILKQPSLYSSLSRFEEKGIVSSYWGDSDIGGRRHYYHLTDIGHKYYNEHVLKIKDEDEDDDDDDINDKDSVTPTMIPVDKDAIPAILNFEVKEKEEIIPDHNFYTKSPILENIKEDKHEIIEQHVIDKDLEIIKKLANQVKITNKRYANTSFKKLHIIKPKKSQKVILDTDGIFKLRDEDYQHNKPNTKENIIDNVIKRTNPTIYGYPSYTDNKKSSSTYTELSEEDKRKKNELFLEKFNNLTKSRIKIVEEKPKPIEKEPEVEIDYRNKLNSIMENNAKVTSPAPQQNNLFNYVDEEESVNFQKTPKVIEDEDDKFIDFEPTEFQVKTENTHYAEEISNYTSQSSSSIQINRYEHKSKVVADDKPYVLINKVKFIFGIILGLFLITELTISYFIFKHFGLITNGDSTLFVVMYILTGILMLGFMIPFFVNSSQHSLNTFRLKHAITYGILVFLVSIILIYCINALMGFELDNFEFFATKLLVPAIMTFNFVIMPPIYYGIIKNKKFYD